MGYDANLPPQKKPYLEVIFRKIKRFKPQRVSALTKAALTMEESSIIPEVLVKALYGHIPEDRTKIIKIFLRDTTGKLVCATIPFKIGRGTLHQISLASLDFTYHPSHVQRGNTVVPLTWMNSEDSSIWWQKMERKKIDKIIGASKIVQE